MDFAPGQRNATITILPQSDIIPEINETFFFSISAGEGGEDILGDPTSVMITILANDDFAGVFLFETSSLILSIGRLTRIHAVLSCWLGQLSCTL